jgi:putative hydroxymethylpyrimidine transport system substrate-binding protein
MNRPRRSILRLATAVLALAAALALAACGTKEERAVAPGTEPLDLVLDYFPNADHAGIYGAIASGAYRDAGLDVRPKTPSDPSAPLKLLASRKADLVISYEPELLLARDKGADLVAVGAIVQAPLTSLVSLPAGRIRNPADLRGKTVATAGIPYQSAYLRTILREASVDPADVREVNVGFNLVPALLSRRADAVLGMFWNYEGVELQLQKRNPRIIRMEQVGVPTYNELIFVARREDLEEQSNKVRRFLQATAFGYQSLRTDPEPAIDALLDANPDLDRKLQEASVKATLPVFFPKNEERPFGYMDLAAWRRYAQWMYDQKLLDQPADIARSATNELLPGMGLPTTRVPR